TAPDGRAYRAMPRTAPPGKRTVEEVTAFLQVSPRELVKTLIYVADGKPVAALVRGDHEVNPLKLKAHLGAQEVELAPDDVVGRVTKAPPGFAGPIGLDLDLVVDSNVRGLANFVVGANEADAHYLNVNLGRDFHAATITDLRQAAGGDECPRCGRGHYESHRGIEVGHVFYLGYKYSKTMKATFLDSAGQE